MTSEMSNKIRRDNFYFKFKASLRQVICSYIRYSNKFYKKIVSSNFVWHFTGHFYFEILK